jgi:hypothetical protein
MIPSPCKFAKKIGISNGPKNDAFAQRCPKPDKSAPVAELRRAEAEVFCINRLMTNHRRKCQYCTPAIMPVT